MAYSSYEGTEELGRPNELFVFTAGGTVYRYTSGPSDVTVGGNTYTAVLGLTRSEVSEGVARREYDFEVEMPIGDPVSQIFSGTPAGVRVEIQVYRYQLDDTPTPELVQAFDGIVLGAGIQNDGKTRTLSARPRLGARGRKGPRRTFRSGCQNVLYDAKCGADDTDPAFRASSLSVTSQAGNVLTVTAGLSGTYSAGWFVGGTVEDIASGDRRTILAQSGNVLTLFAPFRTTPTTVNVLAGCDKDPNGDCANKFDRVQDGYDGFYFIPKKNPFGGGFR